MSENPGQVVVTEDIVVSRIIDAPVELVWQAWTDPEYVMRWWGPKHYTSPSCRIDLREGGKFVFAMQAPPEQGGQIHYNSGSFTKILPNKLLEMTQFISDEEGNRVDPASVGLPPDFPKEIRMTVEFKAIRPDMTELVITEYDWPMTPMAVYSLAGLHQSIDKMAESLKK